jgi:hypothetical protein
VDINWRRDGFFKVLIVPLRQRPQGGLSADIPVLD